MIEVSKNEKERVEWWIYGSRRVTAALPARKPRTTPIQVHRQRIEHVTRAWHTNHVAAASADLILALRVVLHWASEVDNSPYPRRPGTYRSIDLIQSQYE